MSSIITQRMTGRMPSDFVVFLIGMRVNRFWKVHRWMPLVVAMPKMIRELTERPELGLLAAESWFGRTTLMLQYWRSAEDLMRYASSKDHAHLPAWRAFNKQVGTGGDVGIWHETYRVQAGNYESVYVNMPPFGLGKAGELLPAAGHFATAKKRLAA